MRDLKLSTALLALIATIALSDWFDKILVTDEPLPPVWGMKCWPPKDGEVTMQCVLAVGEFWRDTIQGDKL